MMLLLNSSQFDGIRYVCDFDFKRFLKNKLLKKMYQKSLKVRIRLFFEPYFFSRLEFMVKLWTQISKIWETAPEARIIDTHKQSRHWRAFVLYYCRKFQERTDFPVRFSVGSLSITSAVTKIVTDLPLSRNIASEAVVEFIESFRIWRS